MSMRDKFNEWRGKDRRRHQVVYVSVSHDFTPEAREFLEELLQRSGASNKIDQLFAILKPIQTELGIISQAVEGEDGPINLLSRKVTESMATQEERLQSIAGRMTRIAEGIDKLQEQLADLKVNNPALEDEITAIEGTAKTIDEDVNPAVEESGGGTGGSTGEGGGVVNP